MSTYGIMKARIADDLARADLGPQIGNAILDAIKHHERTRFYWNEAISTFATVVGQEWYGAADATWIPNVVRFDSLRVVISNSPETLNARTMEDMEVLSAGPMANGDPTDYCYYRQQLRFYPVPNVVRQITAAYVQRLPALVTDSDTNAWMTDGEKLIRTRAKIILWEETIRGEAGKTEGAFLRGVEQEVLNVIRRETATRIGSGAVTTYFL